MNALLPSAPSGWSYIASSDEALPVGMCSCAHLLSLRLRLQKFVLRKAVERFAPDCWLLLETSHPWCPRLMTPEQGNRSPLNVAVSSALASYSANPGVFVASSTASLEPTIGFPASAPDLVRFGSVTHC
jgi:hypothetical protein